VIWSQSFNKNNRMNTARTVLTMRLPAELTSEPTTPDVRT